MENYPGNSNRAKSSKDILGGKEPPKKKVEKVVSGEVVRRKKPASRKLFENFVKGDARSVFSYIAFDVLIPAAKDAISDSVSQGIERMLFGETNASRGRRHRGAQSLPSYTSYNRFSRPTQAARLEDPRRTISDRARSTHNFDEIILETRVEAEEVIDQLFELVAKYDAATVADLYELLGQTGDFTDEKWGWTDLRGSGVTRVRGGYLLDLTRPLPLD